MRRLLRHAEETGRVVAIATRSRALASRARQAGVPVARRPAQVRWDAGGRYVVRLGPLSFVAPAIGRFLQVAVIAGVAALALFLALTLAPSGTVIAYPPTETLTETVTITAVRDLAEPDLAAGRLPAVTVTAKRSYTLAMAVTGTVNVGVGYARAPVTITNTTGAAVVVVAGTVVLGGPEFLDFELEADLTVPAGGSASGTVVARQPGERYNLPAGTITGWFDERYRFLAITNPEPAAGGTSEPRPAPSEADVIAIRQLAASLGTSGEVLADLVAARPHDAVFLRTAEASVTLGTPRPPIGTPSPVLLLDVTVDLSALAVPAATLEAFARQVLVPAGAEGEFIPGTVSARETGASQYDPAADAFTASLAVTGEFARGVTREAIEAAVRGKRPSEAKSILRERYAIQESDVRVVPGWAPFLPRFGFRLDVQLAAKPAPGDPGASATTRE
jgi:hypothetical protein